MDTTKILTIIDEEIGKLQRARAILSQGAGTTAKKGPGRPKKTVTSPAPKAAKKRVMSQEARARIAAAQKKRWAASKKA